jgi:hypothetical protein
MHDERGSRVGHAHVFGYKIMIMHCQKDASRVFLEFGRFTGAITILELAEFLSRGLSKE